MREDPDVTPIGEGPLPKHQRLRTILLAIIDEELSPGAPIPSERRLTTRFGVSRATVREAVGQLVRDGRLTRVHGKGTFVAPQPRVESRLHLASFTDDMRRRGLTPSTTVLSAVSSSADDAVAAALRIVPGAEVARIERSRSADGRPMALEVGWYPLERFPGLLGRVTDGSLYHLLGEYGARPDAGEQTITADVADAIQAALLGITPGAPVLRFHRVASHLGEPVEDVTSWYRADRYQVAMTLEPAVQPIG